MEKKRLIALISLVFLVAFSVGWLLNHRDNSKPQPDLIIETQDKAEPSDPSEPTEKGQLIWVYVVGAVKAPGVYQFPSGSRVFQAVELAGTDTHADTSHLEMARVLNDGETISVPKQGERLSLEAISRPAQGTTINQSNSLVNINTATVEEIDRRLPGIGPSLAQRIVDYRAQHPFARKEDLKEVSGIGDKRYESIRDLITVTP